MRGVTWVVVEGAEERRLGIGGRAMATEAVRSLAAGVQA